MTQLINILILLILAGSPFIYIPFLVQKDKRKQNRLIWIVITALLGLVQCMIYLLILVSFGIPL
jgi:hypothetical protein